MSFRVLLTHDAVRDLEDIYDYITEHVAPGKADDVLDRTEKALAGLRHSPERGVWPRELSALGMREFREIFFKPYRIIYRIIGQDVYVMLIADGRRDMQTLLQRRLLRA
ncbi:MAG: type II toxin-antitoxin system RelE/ParE family toxin [Desulfovibrionales bacterium]|nr:MAG: type II toxin-antitoxin system RelE/ParE family toxin [Desulfovibrionales bacterium]